MNHQEKDKGKASPPVHADTPSTIDRHYAPGTNVPSQGGLGQAEAAAASGPIDPRAGGGQNTVDLHGRSPQFVAGRPVGDAGALDELADEERRHERAKVRSAAAAKAAADARTQAAPTGGKSGTGGNSQRSVGPKRHPKT